MADDLTLKAKFTADTSELKQAVEETQEMAGNAKSKLEGILGGLGKLAITTGEIMAKGIAVASAGIIALTKQGVSAYGTYEQLVGGVETLFGESAEKLIELANTAYKVQGLSANSYMELATSFSARLIQNLGGDTDEAVRLTDVAISDMMDNVNKMGTSFESVQNAYNGFAKANFMMLDNLKLGYGGTKTEMERLLADAEKISGIKYDINKFSDMIDAIHVIQQEIGITGTTALEAEGTITGSMSRLTSAWQNLLVGMADSNADVDKLLDDVVESFTAVANNMIPKIQQIFATIPHLIENLAPQIPAIIESLLPSLIEGAVALYTGLAQSIPTLIETIKNALPIAVNGLYEIIKTLGASLWSLLSEAFSNVDEIVSKITNFMDKIGEEIEKKIPELASKALPILLEISKAILENIPQIVRSGMNIIAGLIRGLMDALPDLIKYIPQIISNLANTITNSMQIIIGKGIEIVWALIKGIVEAIPALIENFWNIIKAIFDVWNAINWLNLGKNLVNGIANGIKNAWVGLKNFVGNLGTNLKNMFTNIWNNIAGGAGSIWSNIITNIKNIVAGLIPALKSTLMSLLSNVTSIFNSIKSAITNPIELAKNTIKKIIDVIVGLFKFEWNLPKIKLPHFKIKPDGWVFGDLLKGDIPKLTIDWYAKGGILNKPTIFGVNDGRVMAGGEAGAEAVAPIDTLQEYVKIAVDDSNNHVAERLDNLILMLSDYLPQLSNQKLVLDTGVLVGEIASPLDATLGTIQRRKER